MTAPDDFAGILLAAGAGSRFDPAGGSNKLLHPLRNGDVVAVATAKNLLEVLPSVLAVVRPDSGDLAPRLRALGCDVTICATAEQGMAASLVHALQLRRHARGWLIALADMPYVQPATMSALVDAVERGAQIAAPTYRGRRGNPVAFGRTHLDALLTLSGDQGARRLLATCLLAEVATDDPGVTQDIDTLSDLPSP
jgi:molybdenum cofactor cytidylyltransferase